MPELVQESYSWRWPATSEFDPKGQKLFWDAQADGYSTTDMTVDNEGELDLVRALCRQFAQANYSLNDLVAVGGADGSRDPSALVDHFATLGIRPRAIHFNDLSEKMVARATERLSYNYGEMIPQISPTVRPIHELSAEIPACPRRVILGVYRAEGLIKANPHYGYPLSGLDEYRKNADRIGEHLLIEPVRLHREGPGYTTMRMQVALNPNDGSHVIETAHEVIEGALKLPEVDAIRVIGRTWGKEGFFLSHWFTEWGFRRLLETTFSSERREHMSITVCAKGYVACIDPVGRPEGILTALNNVIGNVLPRDHQATLKTIDALTR